MINIEGKNYVGIYHYATACVSSDSYAELVAVIPITGDMQTLMEDVYRVIISGISAVEDECGHFILRFHKNAAFSPRLLCPADGSDDMRGPFVHLDRDKNGRLQRKLFVDFASLSQDRDEHVYKIPKA